MPRRPRLDLPGVPVHLVQRGVNRAAVFIDDEDRTRYIELLDAALGTLGIGIHAYVLMTNHVHLLVSAPMAGSLSRAMCRLGPRYVPEFNRKYRRSGTLWEGRFKSCLVDSERYLLSVYRYIELNPVRAAMVADPEHYAWSSVHGNLGTRADPLLTPHSSFQAFVSGRMGRDAYREWLVSAVTDEELARVREHLRQERALGSQRFQAMVAESLNRPVQCPPRGRPRREPWARVDSSEPALD